ncbi:MAG: Type secretion signal domain, partial [Bacteroidota bacterium]
NDNLKIFTDTKILNPIMQVYDRWGNKVYETEDITNSWKGEYSNGQLGEMGIYFYLLKYKCAVNDKDYVKKGDILLVK